MAGFAGVSGFLCVFCSLLFVVGSVKIRILHLNDVHGRVEQASRFQGACDAEDKAERACFGGFAKVATVVKQKRAEGDDLLVLDAGDEFVGTTWTTVYRGNATAQILNKIGVNAYTLGNHEFDFGPSVTGTFVDMLEMPVLASNLDTEKEPALQGKIAPYTILDVQGSKVGIVGSITEETAIISSIGPNLVLTDLAQAMQKAIDDLKAQGVCTIIGLTHQGYDEDLELASKLTSIDVIIGGHSHTKPEIYPNIVKSKDGADVAVVQAFWATRYLGYLEVDVGDGCQLVSATGELIELGDNPDEPESFVEDDEEITALIETLRKPIADFSMEVVGTTNVFLNAERGAIRASETNLGSLICEAMVWSIQTETSIEENFGPVNLCLTNSGGIRSSIREGEITAADVFTTLPFGNVMVVLAMSPMEIYSALETGFRRSGEPRGEFPQISGMRFKFCASLPMGERIVSVEIFDGAGFLPIMRDDTSTKFNFITNSFLAAGGDGYDTLAEAERVFPLGSSIDSAFINYIREFSPISAETDGRIQEECPP